MNVTTIGLDIAKSVFHLVGAEANGKPVLKKRLRRNKVLALFRKSNALCHWHRGLWRCAGNSGAWAMMRG